MNKHREIVPHLSSEEVRNRFSTCKDARVKSWWQAIWLRMNGKTTIEVSQIINCKPDWVRRIVRRWNAQGEQSMQDQRNKNVQRPILSLEQRGELLEALMGPAPDGGLWNGTKVAQWISEKVGYKVPYNRGWTYMKELGFSCQTPRPRHQAASKELQEEFKKNSPNYIPILGVFVQKQKSKFGRKMKHV